MACPVSKPYFNRVLKKYLISSISLCLMDSLLVIKGQYSVCYKITWGSSVRSDSEGHPLEKIISKGYHSEVLYLAKESFLVQYSIFQC